MRVPGLGRAGLSSFLSPACQDSGLAGHALVGVVSLSPRLFLVLLLPLPPLLPLILRAGLLDVVCRLALIFFVWFMGSKALPLDQEKLVPTEALLDAVLL